MQVCTVLLFGIQTTACCFSKLDRSNSKYLTFDLSDLHVYGVWNEKNLFPLKTIAAPPKL
jgi:hypothetical protein